MTIPHEAARGLEQSDRWRWKFWKKNELNLADAERCLDRLERLQPEPGQAAVLAMARAAAPSSSNPGNRLAVMRTAMQALTEQVSADLCPLAGLALTLRAASDPAFRSQVERGLAAELPDSGLLGEVAPSPGWLLEHSARPYPAGAAHWTETLAEAPPESVSRALDKLASQEVRAFLQQTRSLGLEEQPALERQVLASFEQTTSGTHRAARFLAGEERREGDLLKLGAWLARAAQPQPLGRLARELNHPEGYRALARHLDQPEWLRPACELATRVPPRQLAGVLSALAPEDATLAWVARIPAEESARAALQAFAGGQRSRPALLLGCGLPPHDSLSLVDSPHPLLQALKAQPWPDAAAQARAVATGWTALETHPDNVAGAGLAMARSVRDINQKLFLARGTLISLGAHELVALTRVEGPNQEWSQAALALAALRHLEKGRTPSALELVREASETWAGPPWRRAMLEHLARENPVARTLLEDPDKLYLLAADSLLSSAVTGVDPGGVTETQQAVVVGGVRLAKRGVQSAPGAPLATGEPCSAPAPDTLELGPPPSPGTRVEVTWLERRHRGVGAAYNPLTGQIDVRERLNRGVAAVFNPRKGQVEFKEGARYRGVGGCFDPVTGEVQFHEAASRLRTVAVVYDPGERRVVVRESPSRNYGVGLALNPTTGALEEKSGRERGFGAVFHPETGQLEWRERRERGVVAVSNDPERPTLAGGSYAPHQDD